MRPGYKVPHFNASWLQASSCVSMRKVPHFNASWLQGPSFQRVLFTRSLISTHPGVRSASN